jgi:hypothetical protein
MLLRGYIHVIPVVQDLLGAHLKHDLAHIFDVRTLQVPIVRYLGSDGRV